jgi:hypothetical protein
MEYTLQTRGETIGKKVSNDRTIEVSLNRHELLRLEGSRRPAVIQSLDGTLWITIPGDLEDYTLKPGETLALSRRGPMVVEALPAGRARITEA